MSGARQWMLEGPEAAEEIYSGPEARTYLVQNAGPDRIAIVNSGGTALAEIEPGETRPVSSDSLQIRLAGADLAIGFFEPFLQPEALTAQSA